MSAEEVGFNNMSHGSVQRVAAQESSFHPTQGSNFLQEDKWHKIASPTFSSAQKDVA